MAQHLAFSTGIGHLNAEEIEWVRVRVAGSVVNGYSGLMGLPAARMIPLGISVSVEFDTEDNCWFCWIRSIVQPNGVRTGDVDQACQFISDFLGSLRRTEVHCFTWAEWDDKPRLEAFFGGAVCISAENIEKWDSNDWMVGTTEMFMMD